MKLKSGQKYNRKGFTVFPPFAFCYMSLERGILVGSPPGEDLCCPQGFKTTEPPSWWISTDFLPDGAYAHSCFLPQLPLFPSKCTFSSAKADPAWGLAPSIFSGSIFSSEAELHFPSDLQIGQVLTGHAGVWCLVPQLALLHEPH